VGSPSAQRYLLALVERVKPARDPRLEQEVTESLKRLGPADPTPPLPDTRALSAKAAQP
jgi:hypothetical protein